MSAVTASWARLASSSRLQRSSQTVSIIGKQAWIFGGELHPRQPVDNQFDIVELSNGSASIQVSNAAGTEAPTPRVGSASTVLNDTIYLFSGRGGVAMAPVDETGRLWTYSPTASWKLISPADATAPYPSARSYHSITNNGKDTVYLHAGCPESGRLSDLWAFNVSTMVWTNLPAAPDPPRGGASIAYCAGKVYRLNGFDGQTELGGSLDVYNPGENAWSTITYSADGKNGPEARSVCVLLALKIRAKDTLVTAFGEHDPSSLGHAGAGRMLGDVWAFDIASGHWTKIEPADVVPQPRSWFDADVVKGDDGKDAVLVHGGLAEDNSRLGDVFVKDFFMELKNANPNGCHVVINNLHHFILFFSKNIEN